LFGIIVFWRRSRFISSDGSASHWLLQSGKAKSCGLNRLGAEFDAGTANRSAKPM
jgi:hypothetical protein